MTFGIALLTISAYGLALFLWWRERTPNYVVALLAGHLASLPSPLWQRLYQFSYNTDSPALLTMLGHPLPRIVFLAAWTSLLPALLVFFLYRNRWWFPGYSVGLLTFVVFVIYHIFIESIGVGRGWWSYTGPEVLPFGLRMTLIAALMNALVSLGTLSLLIMTRRYAWLSLAILLLPMPLVLSLFVNGLLGAPLYTAGLLKTLLVGSISDLTTQSWPDIIGVLGTLVLLLWAAHIVARSLDGQRVERQFV